MTSTYRSARRAAGISLAATALVVAVAGNPPVAEAASPAAITIQNFAFMPRVLTITAGTTVIWTNKDNTPHTLAEVNKVFRSAALDTGDTFSHIFASPGDFQYFCTIHTMMTGEIIVKPAKN